MKLDVECLNEDSYLLQIEDKRIIYDVRRNIFGEEYILEKLIGLQQIDKKNFIAEESKLPIYIIALHISNKCCLKCNYCYLGDNFNYLPDFTHNNLSNLIEFINVHHIDTNNLLIAFIGAEPLEEFELIKYTIDKLSKLNQNIKYSLNTNGLLLKGEKLNYVLDKFSTINLSLDGNKISHDSSRKKINGNGSYDEIVQNIFELNNLKNKKVKLNLVSVISNDLEENTLIELVNHHMQFNPNSLKIYYERCNSKWQPERIESTKVAIYHLWKYFTKSVKEGKIIPIKHFKALISKLHRGHKIFYGCDGGTFSLYINGNTVYPCGSMINDMYKLGDLNTKELDRNLIVDRYVDNIDSCKVCWARYICGGKCHIDKSNNCELLKFDIAMAMNAYIEIYNENLNLINQIVSEDAQMVGGYIKNLVRQLKK